MQKYLVSWEIKHFFVLLQNYLKIHEITHHFNIYLGIKCDRSRLQAVQEFVWSSLHSDGALSVAQPFIQAPIIEVLFL